MAFGGIYKEFGLDNCWAKPIVLHQRCDIPLSLIYAGDFDDPYIKRKELIKSGLLLGAGVLKGALITTLINNANNNNGK